MKHDQPFRRRADVLWRRSLDAVVLLPSGATDVVTIAGTGVDVWDLLDTWRTIDTLTELLGQQYGADPGVVVTDVTVFVDGLDRIGALEAAADSGAPATG